MSYEYAGLDPNRELLRLAQIVQCYERATALTYGTTVRPDGSVSRAQMITATNGVAFTVANPTMSRENAVIALDFYNNSGGVLGAVTFGTDYELTTAFTAPANGAHLLYVFYRSNDKKWREYCRTGAIQTGDIAASAVTYAKIQNVAASPRLLGRTTAGAGVIEELTAGSGISLAAGVVNSTNVVVKADANQATFVNAQTNITNLSWAIAANEIWIADIVLSVVMGTAATGVKFYFTFPAGCTGEIHYEGNIATILTWQSLYQAVLTVPGTFFVTGIITGTMRLRAVVRNGGTGGTMQLVGITGGATTTCAVQKGSCILAYKV